MEKISLKSYARKNKMSIFQVVKKIQKGELNAETIEENGVKTQYILLDKEAKENKKVEKKENIEKESQDINEFEFKSLIDEIKLLRKEIEELKELINNRFYPSN